MAGPLGRLPQGIELQGDAGQPQVTPQAGTHQDLFGIDIRAGKAQRLDADLMELAITPFLGAFVAKHLTDVVEPLGLVGNQVMLDDSAHATCGTLRTQRQRLAVEAVDKRVHLLLDDIGDLADGPLEQRCRLDDRQAQGAVAVALEPRTDGLLEQIPELGLVRQDIVHPAYGLDLRSDHLLFLW